MQTDVISLDSMSPCISHNHLTCAVTSSTSLLETKSLRRTGAAGPSYRNSGFYDDNFDHVPMEDRPLYRLARAALRGTRKDLESCLKFFKKVVDEGQPLQHRKVQARFKLFRDQLAWLNGEHVLPMAMARCAYQDQTSPRRVRWFLARQLNIPAKGIDYILELPYIYHCAEKLVVNKPQPRKPREVPK